MQLVAKGIKVYLLRKGVKDIVLYDKAKVKEKYEGLSPEQLVDYKALRGDSSDNIPGITGIGRKTAIRLLRGFGSLDSLYREINKDGEAGCLNEKTKKLLDEGKLQEARELIDLGEEIPGELSVVIKEADESFIK